MPVPSRPAQAAAEARSEAPSEALSEVLAEVRRIPMRSSRFVTDVLTGGYLSTFRGAGIEFEEVREYAEGDDPRHVDWNVTARVGRPFVKRFVEEREHTLMFALDRSASMHAGFGAWSPAQAAVRFCALLGLLAIANNDGVGCTAGSETAERYVPPRKGGSHVMAVLRECLPGLATPAGSNLGALLSEVSRRTRRRTVVFLLSDFLTTGYARELASCSRRHDLVAVRFVSPELIDPPAAIVRAVDPETGRTTSIDFGDNRVRAAWLDRMNAMRLHVDAELAKARVDRIDVDIPRQPDIEAIAAPLQRFFRLRERREVYR